MQFTITIDVEQVIAAFSLVAIPFSISLRDKTLPPSDTLCEETLHFRIRIEIKRSKRFGGFRYSCELIICFSLL